MQKFCSYKQMEIDNYLGAAATQNCIPIQVPGQNKVVVGSTNGYIFCFPVP